MVSLITIEYDVREDQPEETEVFRLEPVSLEIIEKIIYSRFKYISKVDAHTIAEFSGGNARIAIALANTIKRDENLANLRDEELFVRLFQQRNVPNNSLLKTAEVCSLVYSFDCQTEENKNTELKLLGSLIGMDIREIYENISELKRRDLIQQRSIWRAVLPHAIANRLAKRALENIPLDNIYSAFEKSGSERLLKSFSRRLSYLHECEAAIEISKKWLSENGLLGDVINLNDLGITLFKNIAPINPELALSVIERVLIQDEAENFFTRDNSHYVEFTRLLRSIAYDAALFERAAALLCRFALTEKPNENNNSIRDILKSLFYIYLSGTHASPEQRLNIISKCMGSNNNDQIDLGITLLRASLESWHFVSHYSYDFGARSRDYGFTPSNRDDIHKWFKLFIEYSVLLAISNHQKASVIKDLLAEKFRGLWIKAGMYDELEAAAMKISNTGPWMEGWTSVRSTKRFDGKKMNPEILTRINNLDGILKPTTLIEKVRLYAFSRLRGTYDLAEITENENISEGYIEVDKITRALGCDVGINTEILRELYHIEKMRRKIFWSGPP